ncbi:MAG: glycerate kinase [Eubacteriales bacterium]
MKIVIAPDSFKGSLSSIDVINIMKKEALKTFADADVIGIPIADGGEGTIDAMLFGSDGEKRTCTVLNPLGEEISAEYGIIGDTAIIEMASCSGLTLIGINQRNPLKTTSFGTGQMIKNVLDAGYRKILIGIGGSATNDGGMGAMQALGAEFFDIEDDLIKNGCGEKLIEINRISIDNLDSRLRCSEITVMCDVENTLTGESGATYVYGMQKGGSKETLNILEEGMLHYEEKINELFDSEISRQPGAGAAGGMGAALMGFCGAKLTSGIDAVIKIKNFEERIKGADIIITGEGRIDSQSAYGKVIYGVAKHAKKQGIPVIAVAGAVGEGFDKVYDIGVDAIFTLPDRPMRMAECLDKADILLSQLSRNIFELIKLTNKKSTS